MQDRAKGRREQNKEDKLRRIREAAIHLFATKGYDDTTTREIAVRARVGLGTVFVYAETKRDLLFFLVNEDLEACIAAAGAIRARALPFYDTLLGMLRVHYEYFAQAPIVSRAALREMYFYQSGIQAGRFIRTREELARLLEDVIAAAMRDGLIRSAETPSCVAETVFAIFQVHVRRWLAEDTLEIEAGVERLGRQIRVVMHGLSPLPQAFAPGPDAA